MKSYLAAAKLLLLVLLRNDGECALNSTQMKNILDIYDTKKGDLIPRSTNGTFTTRLGFEILNMVPLTFINDHLYVEFGLIETWMDNRLKLTNEDSDEVLILQGDAVSAIWKPDISILNEKGVKHDTFPAIQESVSISLQGIVNYHISLRVTLSCKMSMERFPFDKQECPLNIESYGYTISSLRLGLINTTKDASVTISDSFKISKFILDRYKVEVKQIDYGVSGIFDKVVLTFFLKRDTRYYIMEYYFPIICTVFLSGVSFWINHRVTPARVALPVTTFLTLTSMLQHVRSSAELYGTANCLEIFLNVSNIFVIAVMIQFIFVGSTSRGKREVDKGEGCPARKETCNHASKCCSVLVSTFSRKRRFSVSQKKTMHSQPRIHPLDKIFRYLFPLSYVTFIIIYFIVFNLLL